VSEDPGEDPNSPNLYTYCRNNPLLFADPTGMVSEIPYIPTYEYQGNGWDVVSAFDNAFINVGNDLIGIGNGLINDFKYASKYGLGEYGKASWQTLQNQVNGFGDWCVANWDYTTKTPFKQQVSDTLKVYSNPDYWSGLGTTVIEGYIAGKVVSSASKVQTRSVMNSTEKLSARGMITGDSGILKQKLRLAQKGDVSARTELRVAKYLRNEGTSIHFIDDMAGVRTNDFTVNGDLQVDVKRISGLGRNAAGDLAKGSRQVGPGGQVIVVRPADSKFTFEQYRNFVNNFKPQQANVIFRVINESELPNLYK
jgi:hypothetical protein